MHAQEIAPAAHFADVTADGIHNSVGLRVSGADAERRGMTPTTVYGLPLSVTDFPMMV